MTFFIVIWILVQLLSFPACIVAIAISDDKGMTFKHMLKSFFICIAVAISAGLVLSFFFEPRGIGRLAGWLGTSSGFTAAGIAGLVHSMKTRKSS